MSQEKTVNQNLPFLIIGLAGLIFLTIIIFSCKKQNSNTSTANCPTTSACGCSAKNKAECEASTDCCKWTVGQGCGCK